MQASDETGALITWVTEAPVVSLDNEGQFELLAGTLSEVLCSAYGEWADEGYEGLADPGRAPRRSLPGAARRQLRDQVVLRGAGRGSRPP